MRKCHYAYVTKKIQRFDNVRKNLQLLAKEIFHDILHKL